MSNVRWKSRVRERSKVGAKNYDVLLQPWLINIRPCFPFTKEKLYFSFSVVASFTKT